MLSPWTCSCCYKAFLGGNLDFTKIKKMKKVCSDVWTCTKMLKECYFKQNYTPKLFIAFKMAYYCHFSLGGNLDSLDFLQKKFYKINYRVGITASNLPWVISLKKVLKKYLSLTSKWTSPLSILSWKLPRLNISLSFSLYDLFEQGSASFLTVLGFLIAT